jgi:hypothetical protein
MMDPNALYEIHIDNNGDAKEDLTFQFRFKNTNKDTKLTVGGKSGLDPSGDQRRRHCRPQRGRRQCARNLHRQRGARRPPHRHQGTAVTNAADGGTTFDKPLDNIGNKSIPNYAPTPPPTSTTSTSPVAARRRACLSASARIPSSSTWAKPSTWSTSRRRPPSSAANAEKPPGMTWHAKT